MGAAGHSVGSKSCTSCWTSQSPSPCAATASTRAPTCAVHTAAGVPVAAMAARADALACSHSCPPFCHSSRTDTVQDAQRGYSAASKEAACAPRQPPVVHSALRPNHAARGLI